jgi:hypothetical protein
MAFKFTSEHVVGKGENKRCVVAVFEHLQFCERNVKRSALKYPWRMGFLSDKDSLSLPLGPVGMAPLHVPSAPDGSSEDFLQAAHSSVFALSANGCFAKCQKLNDL